MLRNGFLLVYFSWFCEGLLRNWLLAEGEFMNGNLFFKQVLFLISMMDLNSMALAGHSSSGGDSSTAFICYSLPNADVSFKIIGLDQTGNNQIDLFVWIDKHLIITDRGFLGSGVDKFIGETFEIELNTGNLMPSGILIAKNNTPFFNAGDNESVNCQRFHSGKNL